MAAYNGFPATYQPMYYQPQYQQVQTQQQNNGIIWIQGEAAAKSYLVAPNNSVVLFDSERQTIYLKSADASGMPSMKVLDYTIRDTAPVNAPVAAPASQTSNLSAYATKAEIEAITAQINALRADVDSMTKKEGKSDE